MAAPAASSPYAACNNNVRPTAQATPPRGGTTWKTALVSAATFSALASALCLTTAFAFAAQPLLVPAFGFALLALGLYIAAHTTPGRNVVVVRSGGGMNTFWVNRPRPMFSSTPRPLFGGRVAVGGTRTGWFSSSRPARAVPVPARPPVYGRRPARATAASAPRTSARTASASTPHGGGRPARAAPPTPGGRVPAGHAAGTRRR